MSDWAFLAILGTLLCTANSPVSRFVGVMILAIVTVGVFFPVVAVNGDRRRRLSNLKLKD